MRSDTLYDKIYGCLAGGVIGDAMGAPVEGKSYEYIQETYGEISDFSGEGTDDSAIKKILCRALIMQNGFVSADDFAQALLDSRDQYRLFYIPVRNAFHKVDCGASLPVYAGMGGMPSSSTAMSISPMGLVNACNPRQAALETYDVAGLIHGAEATFCRDAACAMAAAVAEAMNPAATVSSVIEAATEYLHPKSSAEMAGYIREAAALAREAGDYAAFREAYCKRNRQVIACDSRETVSCAFALFILADGDVNKAVAYGANYGRDADTIATMAGALAGAFSGAAAIRPEWLRKLEAGDSGQTDLAHGLADVVRARARDARERLALLEGYFKENGES
jgi:ADP-ribosylglycohydrolase